MMDVNARLVEIANEIETLEEYAYEKAGSYRLAKPYLEQLNDLFDEQARLEACSVENHDFEFQVTTYSSGQLAHWYKCSVCQKEHVEFET